MYHNEHKRPRFFGTTDSPEPPRKIRRTVHYVSESHRVFTRPIFRRESPRTAVTLSGASWSSIYLYSPPFTLNTGKRNKKKVVRKASSVPSTPTPAPAQRERILIDLTCDDDENEDEDEDMDICNASADYDELPGASFHRLPAFYGTSATHQGGLLLVDAGKGRAPVPSSGSSSGSIYQPSEDIASCIGFGGVNSTATGNSFSSARKSLTTHTYASDHFAGTNSSAMSRTVYIEVE